MTNEERDAIERVKKLRVWGDEAARDMATVIALATRTEAAERRAATAERDVAEAKMQDEALAVAIRERDEARREAEALRDRHAWADRRRLRAEKDAIAMRRDLSAARSALATHEAAIERVREMARRSQESAEMLQREIDRRECLRQTPGEKAARIAVLQAHAKELLALLSGLTPPTESGEAGGVLSKDEAMCIGAAMSECTDADLHDKAWAIVLRLLPTESTPSDTPEEPERCPQCGDSPGPLCPFREEPTPEAPGEYEERGAWRDSAYRDLFHAIVSLIGNGAGRSSLAWAIVNQIDARVRLTEKGKP